MRNQTSFSLLFVLLSQHSIASELTLEIEGQGQVTAVNLQQSCNESCTLLPASSSETLIAAPATNWKFIGWQAGKCSSGNGIISSSNAITFDTTNGGAKTLASADVNGDGIADLASIQLFTGIVSIHTNDGNGQFSQSETITKFDYPAALTFYDWDNDGDQDLLATDYSLGGIKLMLNDGNGQFSFARDLFIDGITPYAIAAEDINNDGLADLVISSFDSDISGDLYNLVDSIENAKTAWYIQNEGEFSEFLVLSNNAAFTLDAATDQNNQMAVVAAELETTEIALYLSEDGKVQRSVIESGGDPYGATLGDIDNNGTLDILSTFYYPSRSKLARNLGSYAFAGSVTVDTQSEGLTATAIADLDNDGMKDIALGVFNDNRFYYYPTSSYQECSISTDSDMDIVAYFEQQTVEQEQSVEAEKPSPSGGSASYFILLILGLLSWRRRIAAK